MGIPNLEERFLEPHGWTWRNFTRDNRALRYGYISPPAPAVTVVCLPGLSEFGEKYFETARDCLKQNMAFYVLDWMGQGKSGRYIKDSHKRHSNGYQQDINDLHALIANHVKGNAPLVLLAHSMGAHVGLHYVAQHPNVFQCAAFSAPLLALKAFETVPDTMAFMTAQTANKFFSTSYALGMADWRKEIRSIPAINFFSGDEKRNAVHNAWCLADDGLQVGGITYGWLYETQKSCMALRKPGILESIKIPCILALAGREKFVSNAAIRKAAKVIPNAKLLEFPDSRHEILMEQDSIRKVFLDAFYELIKAQKQG